MRDQLRQIEREESETGHNQQSKGASVVMMATLCTLAVGVVGAMAYFRIKNKNT